MLDAKILRNYINELGRKVKTIESVIAEADTMPIVAKWELKDAVASMRYALEEMIELLGETPEPMPICASPTRNPITFELIRCQREYPHVGNHANLDEPMVWA